MSQPNESQPIDSRPIKSRPVYPGLRPVAAARRNVVVVDTEGAAAAARMLDDAPAGFDARTEVVVAGAGEDAPPLQEYGARVHVVPDVDAALLELGRRLTGARMGTRLYAAGSEGLVGRVVGLALEHGIDPRSVLTEHAGTQARRVQCVHCKVTAESVTTTPYTCPGCGRLLLVRDHYSARLAAFQGVCVNAEDPSERPAPEEVFT